MMARSFSKARHSVLAYAEAHPEEVSYLSARELGERCGVSDSTVIRAVQSIGHRGYPQYQEWLRKDLARRRTTVERFAKAHEKDPLAKVFSRDVENLKSTWENLSQKNFRQAARILARAPRVWLLGLRMSRAVAVILKEGLAFLGIDVRLLVAGNGDFWDEASAVDSGDVFISIGLPRYTRITVELTAFAKRKGARLIAITNGPSSPLTALADIVFTVSYDLEGYIESFTAAVSLAQALLVAVSLEKGKEGLAALQEKEKLWAEQRVYWSNSQSRKRARD